MKKVIIGILILVIIVAGGYLLFHKSSKPTATASSTMTNEPTVNNAVLVSKTNARVGQYLADPKGNALYTFGSDTSGVSNCTGPCLSEWPAYQDKGATVNLPSGVSTIKRTDNGQIQYTYMGMPLYYFVSDSQGQVTGNGDENFHVAKPSSSSSTQASPTPSSPDPSPSSSPTSSPSRNSTSGYYQ